MTVVSLQPVRATSATLTELVFESIRTAIVTRELPPGARLRESGVADLLKVSKTPVREALLRLRHIGLVELSDSGLSVVRPSAAATRDAYEYRAGLERVSAELAARRASEFVGRELAQLAQESLDRALAGDRAGFREADGRLHRGIARASGNPRLEQAVSDCLVLVSAIRIRDLPDVGDSVACAREHVAIAQAIASGNRRAAGEAMQTHVEHVMAAILGVDEHSDVQADQGGSDD